MAGVIEFLWLIATNGGAWLASLLKNEAASGLRR